MRRGIHAGRRAVGGFSLNAFTEDELSDIHLATLEVLQKTGIFVEDEKALEVFHGGGAVVDRSSKVVRIPPHVVEDAIRSAPSKLCLAGRSPEFDFLMESSRVGFTNFGEGIRVVDPYSGELREPTKQDAADTARMVDYLSEVDVYERAIGPHDVPQDVAPLHLAEVFLANCRKHIFQGPLTGDLARKILAMAGCVAGGESKLRDRPMITFVTCPVSPLRLVRDCCEIIMEGARSGAPVNILSMAMAGGSSPVTLAGTLVTHNAEVLSGIVLSQLTCKGAGVVYGSSTTCMDLRSGTAAVGSPELAMINAAVAQLSRYYLLPSWVAGG